MYCTSCGNTLRENDRFCSQCGRKATSADAPAPGEYAPRRLYRLSYDKMIGGVCSGFAKYLDTDVTMVRIITAGLILMTGGVAFLAYVIAWIITPVDHGTRRTDVSRTETGAQPVTS
jgi:phage shock protein C